MDKALWLTSFNGADVDRLLDHCAEAGVTLLCIRTTSSALPGAIASFAKQGIRVYGWRWPAVAPGPHTAPNYYALDEAAYVAGTLIPAGLAGYVVDPESDGPGQVDDWNDAAHAGLATEFCARIRAAAPAGFHLGVTSGCEYPRNHAQIPWTSFVAAADALYPQTYWRISTGDIVHGGTPSSSVAAGMAAWSRIAAGKPIVAIGGELDSVLPQEIRDFGALIAGKQAVAHFYADSQQTSPAILKAIGAL